MAIALQLWGEFDLSSELKDVLLNALGDTARETDEFQSSYVEFAVSTDLLLTTAFHSGRAIDWLHRYGIRGDSCLSLRVRDKGRVLEALDAAVACIGAVLRSGPGNAVLCFEFDTVLLMRVGGDVQLFRTDDTATDFWHRRAQLIDRPYRFARRGTPRSS